MRFSEARRREVVDTTSATTVGRVDGFVVDPRSQRVSGVRVGKGDGNYLAWSDLTSFGVDAVTVEGAGRVRTGDVDDGLDQPDLLGHRVLDEHGVDRGTITDVEFAPTTGEIRYLLTSTEEVDGSLVRGVGTWAVVVALPSGSGAPPPTD